MMSDQLVAVSSHGDNLCVECAEKRYGIELCDVPADDNNVVPVYDYDHWKHEFAGKPCEDCKEPIDVS